MIIALRKKPAIAPRGNNHGRFGKIKLETVPDSEGRHREELVVPVELEAKDPQGNPYRIEKRYNLSGRGLATFQDDFKSWAGRCLSDEEIEQFDPDALMANQPVVIPTRHRKEGKSFVPVIDAFLPVMPVTQANSLSEVAPTHTPL